MKDEHMTPKRQQGDSLPSFSITSGSGLSRDDLPSSTVESSWVTLTARRSILSCREFARMQKLLASLNSSPNMSSACLPAEGRLVRGHTLTQAQCQPPHVSFCINHHKMHHYQKPVGFFQIYQKYSHISESDPKLQDF